MGFGQGVLDWMAGKEDASFGDVLKNMKVSAAFGGPNFIASMQSPNNTDQELMELIQSLKQPRAATVQKIERPPTQTMTLLNDPNAQFLKTYVPAASPLSMRM